MSTATMCRKPDVDSRDELEKGSHDVVLDESEIRRLLPMYKEDSVFMRSAEIRDGRLSAVFNTFEHPFSRPLPKHFTREHALVFITQASYVLAALLQRTHAEWPLNTEQFICLAMAEQSTFTRVDLRFRRFIRNRDGIALDFWCTGFRRIAGRLFVTFAFDFPEGCDGLCEGLVALAGSLQPGTSELTI